MAPSWLCITESYVLFLQHIMLSLLAPDPELMESLKSGIVLVFYFFYSGKKYLLKSKDLGRVLEKPLRVLLGNGLLFVQAV